MSSELIKALALFTGVPFSRINNIFLLVELQNPMALSEIDSLNELSKFIMEFNECHMLELDSLRATKL
ncbi:hypothetical protein PVK63_16410 [Aliivibrio sp. S2TY2]|uniref:hypothetical protein n=1 Tax=unclassified Aliivibrio TaxID=2645654 RepID=UPI00237883ED|nr:MULTISPECIES: hypothetical protein [unclassified Aliivibrio]MDD9176453.1 hypothetical protein [Aliivibrio sp. S3TY1]MDD9193531.1 hypothetical protein [Aliivibrio sp. S2TY2]